MPTYHARGISARLGILPLSDATTRNIVAKKGEVARQQGEAAEKKLRKSKLLTEQSVPFPGDDIGFELNWLGNAPFMQAEIAQASMASAHTTKSDRRNEIDNDYKPEALVLHVQLSDKTFVSGLHKTKTSLKIDVFFNGELASCVFIPIHDVRSGAKSLHQVFAGTRVDYLSERPWVIVRTGSRAGDGGRDHTAASPVRPRWQDICEALQREAQARGTDDKGNIPPSAEFLRALAAMHMPRRVHDMQRPGGRHFGVIDVIISAGDGRKTTTGAGYLKAPQRLIDDNFPLNVKSVDADERALFLSVGDSLSIVPDSIPDDMDAAGESESDCEPHAKRRALATRVLALEEASGASTPFLGRIPSLPPPARTPMVRSPSLDVKSKYNQDPPPPIVHIQGHIQHSVISESRYANHKVLNGHVQGQGRHGTVLRIKSRSARPESAVSSPRATPPPCSSPWSFWGNSSMLTQPSYPNSEDPRSFSTGFQSSPFQHVRPNLDRQVQLLSSSPSVSTGHDIMELGDRYAYPVYTMLDDHTRRNSSASETSGPAPGHDSQFQFRRKNCTSAPLATMCPWIVTASKPHHTSNSIPLYRYNSLGRSSVLAPEFPHPFALRPPLGAYTVPRKPKVNASLNKLQGVERPIKSRQSIRVTRLVVYGQTVLIIDHRWAVPQQVSREPGGWTIGNYHSDGTLPEAAENINGRPRVTKTLTVGLPSEEHASQPGEPSSTSTPQSSANAVMGRPEVHKFDVKDSVGRNQALEPVSYPLRHAVSGSGILGIQGPKAATFWFDNPEEILRGPSRQRRSRSTTKRFDGPVKLPRSKVACSTQSPNLAETTSSSPLSSAPTTPEPMIGAVRTSTIKATPQIPHECGSYVPQSDGSSGRPLMQAGNTSSKTPPPSEELSSEDLRQVACLEVTPMMATPLLSSKKRKTANQCMTKKWRNHERVIEVQNSLLNENCVIAYADIETAGANTGPLRQVKGERQGVFQEDYVVFAARFFVPGN